MDVRPSLWTCAALLLALSSSGCGVGVELWSWKGSEFRLGDVLTNNSKGGENAPAEDTFTLRVEGLVADQPAAALPANVAAQLGEARDLFRRDEFDAAERIFFRVAEHDKNPPAAVQEAMYYRAECLRKTGYYPKAADVYSSLLGKFPNTAYREQCVQQLYTIANYWLDDTRTQMREAKEVKEGKRWLVWPRWFSLEKSKPFLDPEGRAIEKLEQVRLHDINGPLADQALYLCGVVKMYNKDYREADHYLSQIHVRHPESPLAPKAIEMAIFCKHMSTGGSDYDGRKAAEARKLVQTALRSYPVLANDPKKREALEKHLQSIDLQQAKKDFDMAEFYRRTGKPGSAYWYYELVRRRYPGTLYARKAEERWAELRAQIEQQQSVAPATIQPGTRPAAPPARTHEGIQ